MESNIPIFEFGALKIALDRQKISKKFGEIPYSKMIHTFV